MEHNSIVTSVENLSETVILLISHSISTYLRKMCYSKQLTQRNHPTRSKNKQTTGFSKVTPEQSKLTKPLDTAPLSMIPKSDPEFDDLLEWLPTRFW